MKRRTRRSKSEVQAGVTTTIRLTYEAWQTTTLSGNAFVHVYDDQGALVAQDDHAPQMGAYPTDLWQAGECVDESFNLRMPPTVSGTLHALTGFYVSATGARFRTGTQDDLLPLGQILVR